MVIASRRCAGVLTPAVKDVVALSHRFVDAVESSDWPRARELRDKIKEWKP
jgi:hypothetical protein